MPALLGALLPVATEVGGRTHALAQSVCMLRAGCERRSLVLELWSREAVAPLSLHRRATRRPLLSGRINSTYTFNNILSNNKLSKRVPLISLGSASLWTKIGDLELLTNQLDRSGDHLNLLFAVASYLQRVPSGRNRLTPAVIEQRGRSAAQLAPAA